MVFAGIAVSPNQVSLNREFYFEFESLDIRTGRKMSNLSLSDCHLS